MRRVYQLVLSSTVFLALLSADGAFAQNLLKGVVKDPDALVEKSEVYRKKIFEGSATNAEGNPRSASPRPEAGASAGRIFCCDDANHRRVCSDFLPTECQSRAYEERDTRGYVVNRVEAPLTAAQQAQRDAIAARREADAKKTLDERRRTLALLSTYSNEAEIDTARDRLLGEADKTLKEAQGRLDEANKKKEKLDASKEFYKGKALPPEVKAQFSDNEREIKAQQLLVDGQLKIKDDIRREKADEKKRYLELTGKKSAASGEVKELPSLPGGAPAPKKN